jgi:pyruvate-ferredoxin/flavodoxin oxidoreductase
VRERLPREGQDQPASQGDQHGAQAPILDRERERFEAFLDLPQIDRTRVTRVDVKGSQLMLPLFEYSGACAGCGETPYVKLLTQLFGDRLLIANATGCSSIYCGNLPTTPFTTDEHGRGPAWSNSLFEDNAEFGFGMRLAVDALALRASGLLEDMRGSLDGVDVDAVLGAGHGSEPDYHEQRARVERIRDALTRVDTPEARQLAQLADYLVHKSVWLVGGDGWAFDIGYGGLDHVLASGVNINALVLDTEVYSNTGGQASKATPIGRPRSSPRPASPRTRRTWG